MANNSNAINVPAIVETANFKASSTSGLILCIVLNVFFTKTSMQKVWDNLMIDGASIQAISIGRRKAKELAVACGLEKRPSEDEVSKLVGHEVTVRITVDDDGNLKVIKYMPAENETKPVGSELPF